MDVQGADDSLSAVFTALAHPTRRAILAQLAQGEADVAQLCAPFGLSQPTISRHLKVLENARLIETTRDAQRRPRVLRVSSLKEAAGWLERFRELWERRLDNLDEFLATTKDQEK